MSKQLLDKLYVKYALPDFIEDDPISIPHAFSQKQDIEIAGFFAAIFAWGNRKTIINKAKELMSRMDNSPYDFIVNHQEQELKALESFVHRTFQATDLYYFIHRLQLFYQENDSLEFQFAQHLSDQDKTIENALRGFYHSFFTGEYPARTTKHIATPDKNSTCKRLCMFLRWMVRKDDVDFGLWKKLSPAQLMIPYDVHVSRIAHKLKLVHRKQTDWKTVMELTNQLRTYSKTDPVKYDFALFGASVSGEL